VTTVAAIVVILGCSLWLLPTASGLDRYVITGGSMSGTLGEGSTPFAATALVTHRTSTTRPREDGLVVLRTKGDADASRDPWGFSLAGSSQPVFRLRPAAGPGF
jgi:hypothetical protein